MLRSSFFETKCGQNLPQRKDNTEQADLPRRQVTDLRKENLDSLQTQDWQ